MEWVGRFVGTSQPAGTLHPPPWKSSEFHLEEMLRMGWGKGSLLRDVPGLAD